MTTCSCSRRCLRPGAHAAEARLGSATTSHSQVQYDNGMSGPGMGGMKMGITP
jgi:hypothetical protein